MSQINSLIMELERLILDLPDSVGELESTTGPVYEWAIAKSDELKKRLDMLRLALLFATEKPESAIELPHGLIGFTYSNQVIVQLDRSNLLHQALRVAAETICMTRSDEAVSLLVKDGAKVTDGLMQDLSGFSELADICKALPNKKDLYLEWNNATE